MASLLQKRGAAAPGPHALVVPAFALLWVFAGCVDLTKPREIATAKGGAAGGQPIDGAAASGGMVDTGMGGEGGAAGAIDAPGGAIDLGRGGAGGGMGGASIAGMGGSVVDVDGGPDVPEPGTGGIGGGGGTIGGAGGDGGATSSGGTDGTGGATGGTTAAGGSPTSDGGPDTPPDAGPDASLDTRPDAPADTEPDLQSDANPLLGGLVVYYPCESATGTDLPDISGKGHDGTLSIGVPPDGGTPPTGAGYEFVTGKVGKALALHKAGLGYLRVPTAVFAGATDLTIAVWVSITTSQSWQRVIDVGITANLFMNTPTNTKYLNLVPKNAASTMLFSITTNGFTSEQQLTAPTPATATWTHLAVVLASDGGGRLYVNGSEANANSSLTLRPADLGAIDYAFVGKSQFDADPVFDGLVDEFRVYNRALSATEVLALYNFAGP